MEFGHMLFLCLAYPSVRAIGSRGLRQKVAFKIYVFAFTRLIEAYSLQREAT